MIRAARIAAARSSINSLNMLHELTASGVGIGAFDPVVASTAGRHTTRSRTERQVGGNQLPYDYKHRTTSIDWLHPLQISLRHFEIATQSRSPEGRWTKSSMNVS